MTVLDYILDGLEAELTLERELGVRFVEIEKKVEIETKVEVVPKVEVAKKSESTEKVAPAKPAEPKRDEPIKVVESASVYPFLFLHHREMGPQELEMMTKIVEKLGFTLDQTPIVYESPIPRAKFYIILGTRALQKFQPGKHFGYETWFTTEKGVPMLFTRAPSEILRFKGVSPALQKLKLDMWRSIKAVAAKMKTM